MNVDLMLKVAEAIEAEPARWNLGIWLDGNPENICGTVGCMAGTALFLDAWSEGLDWKDVHAKIWSRKNDSYRDWIKEGARVLDIPLSEADRMFTTSDWWVDRIWELGMTPDADEDGYVSLDTLGAKQCAEVIRAVALGHLEL